MAGKMKKIVIIGPGGSGKSTLARQLGAAMGLEVIHLDSIFWRPGWVETPHEEWLKIQKELVSKDAWIIDGNYGGTQDIRFEAADMIIFLDIVGYICFWRVVKRWLRYAGRPRPDLAPGCPEKLDPSFLAWIWNYRRDSRPLVLERLAKHSNGRRIVVLHSPNEVRKFLDEVHSSLNEAVKA